MIVKPGLPVQVQVWAVKGNPLWRRSFHNRVRPVEDMVWAGVVHRVRDRVREGPGIPPLAGVGERIMRFRSVLTA